MQMDERSTDTLFDMFARRWEKAIGERRYNDAVMIAIAAHLAFQETGAEELESIGLSWLVATHTRISGTKDTEATDDLVCSFCAQRKDESEIIVGVNGQICKGCVKNIFSQLK
jgi:hypothetical protein